MVHIKEVKLRPKTDIHDIQVKLRHIERFLKEGLKTKVTLVFRGRELAHPEIGKRILDKVSEEITEWGVIEQEPKFEGRTMVMMLAPRSDSKADSKNP